MKTIRDIGEDRLIERFSRRYKHGRRTIVGIGDDSAVINWARNRSLLFTSDMMVEGVHFSRKELSAYQIGWKALGSGLSDIAAMAGEPICAVVSLGLPARLSTNFADELARGIHTLANRFNVDIVGGDTVNSPKEIVISIAVIGNVPKNGIVLRKGANAGDKIFVTGTLGGSRKRKQYSFIPRIKEAQQLTRCARINSMMDITDGLSLDLYRLVTASGVGARLYEEQIPVSDDACGIRGALSDGEDFELLFTTADAKKLLENWSHKDVPITVIGEIIKGKGRLELVTGCGMIKPLAPGGYEHFTSH